jgi:hypothetical protein
MDTSPDAVSGFEHSHIGPRLYKRTAGYQACHSGSYHDDILFSH